MDFNVLKKLGFSDKSATVYLALLTQGPSSVRSLAEYCDMNRGSAYDALKWLQEAGVVNYYHKDTKQTFVAEDPDTLHSIVRERKRELQEVDVTLEKMIPELQAVFDKGGERPIARYYERNEISKILEDVIATCEQTDEPVYRIYSAAGIRQYLYEGFQTFSDVRVSKGISVRVIAVGDGGELRGLDERKWIDKQGKQDKQSKHIETYIIIYPGKTAYISLNAKNEPIGVVIENDGIYETQKNVFETLWSAL